MTPFNNETVDEIIPGTRPSPTFTPSLAGPQPWVVHVLKAHLVDLILGYEERLEESRLLEARLKYFEKENETLRLERKRFMDVAQSFMGCIGVTVERQDEPLSQAPEICDPMPGSRIAPIDDAMNFLKEYCDPADVFDVEYGPIGERREILYHGH